VNDEKLDRLAPDEQQAPRVVALTREQVKEEIEVLTDGLLGKGVFSGGGGGGVVGTR
jgi:hypothetical protein